MRSAALLAALAFAAAVGGCSTAADVAGIAHSGEQWDGSYLPTDAERAMDCQTLLNAISGRIERMRDLPARAVSASDAAPKTVVEALGRVVGAKAGDPAAIRQYDSEKTRVRAMNKLAAGKNCKTVDLDFELKTENELMAAARDR